MQGPQAITLFVSLFILCVSGASSFFSASEYQTHFTSWQQAHRKAYRVTEFAARFANFMHTLDFIRTQNHRNLTFTLGLNEYSDLTVDEYRNLLLYPIAPIPSTLGLRQHTEEGHATRAASVDWRTSGAVQAIKNQGTCGSCWTFATAASIESITKIKTGILPNLSEQNLLDCVTQGSSGCGGGVPYYGTTYVINNKGISSASSYPYTGVQGTCKYNAANSAASITGVVQVTRNSEAALQSALNLQPVSIAIDAGLQTFQSYKSGIYNDAACSSTVLNHAVVAVGYGSDATGEYYIVRNSWGTTWGEQGYVRIAKNAGNRCGVATNGLYPTK